MTFWGDKQSKALEAVFIALNASNIEWMILRNYEGLPFVNRSKDIDIAVSRNDVERISGIIRGVLYEQNFHFWSSINYMMIECNTYVCIEDNALYSIKIDILSGFVWRGADVTPFSKLYKSARKHGQMMVPSEEHDVFMLWLKPLITGGVVRGKYRHLITDEIKYNPDRFKIALINTLGEDVGNTIWTRIKSNGVDSTVHYKRIIRTAVWVKSLKEKPANTIIGLVKHYYIEFCRRVKLEQKYFFAVVGPDGVGKTTFINRLNEEIAKVLIKEKESIHIQHFRPHILPNLSDIMSKSAQITSHEYHNPHRAEPAGRVSSVIRLIYYWFDYVIGYYSKIRRQMNKGDVIIYDRYIYDFVVDPRRSRLSAPMWIRKLFISATPQPKLVFFLNSDSTTVYQRKQELPEHEIDRQLEAYRVMSNQKSARFVIINANMPTETQVSTALIEIIQRSFKKN